MGDPYIADPARIGIIAKLVHRRNLISHHPVIDG